MMVDIPAGTTSTAIFEGNPLIFASFSGDLEAFDDRDWIRISLVAGQTYDFYGSVTGVGPGAGDSVLQLYNSSGALVATNDDDGVGSNSLMTFTVITSGTYFVSISDFFGNPGQYGIGVTANQGFVDDQDSDGDDVAQLISGSVRVLGGKGDDRYTSYSQALGEQGDDQLIGTNAGDVLSGGLGNDLIYGQGGDDWLFGDAGFDRISGEDGADRIFGGEGGDNLSGEDGANQIHGGGGGDRITGGADGETHWGDAGDDQLFGLGGSDRLFGGEGNDKLDGGIDFDQMTGGLGNDQYVVDASGDVVSEIGGSGVDLVQSKISLSLSNTFAVKGSVEHLTLLGTAANGNGNAIANTLTGNASSNALNGLGGNDRLLAGAGNDLLNGGIGIDTLTGGPNNDAFLFNAPVILANRDVITDFVAVNDTIRLENAVFTKLPAGVLHPSMFKLSTQAKDANDYIQYNKATGALIYDSNGSGIGGAVQFATLSTKPTISYLDFVVI